MTEARSKPTVADAETWQPKVDRTAMRFENRSASTASGGGKNPALSRAGAARFAAAEQSKTAAIGARPSGSDISRGKCSAQRANLLFTSPWRQKMSQKGDSGKSRPRARKSPRFQQLAPFEPLSVRHFGRVLVAKITDDAIREPRPEKRRDATNRADFRRRFGFGGGMLVGHALKIELAEDSGQRGVPRKFLLFFKRRCNAVTEVFREFH
jgi:hypothetical protein